MQETSDHTSETDMTVSSAFQVSPSFNHSPPAPLTQRQPGQNRNCRRITAFGLAMVTSMALVSNEAPAQPEPRKQIELYGGGRRLNSPAPPRPNAPRTISPGARQIVSPPPPQLTQNLLEQARQLEGQSTQAFQRGLLPLQDYLEHLRMVHQVERRAAIDRQDRRALLNAAQANVTRLNQAAEQLAAFREPAAEGWEADVLLARAAAAEAAGELATLKGDRSEATLARQKFQTFAWQHLQAVEFDRRELGLSSLPTMATAVTMAVQDEPGATPELSADLQRYVVLTTEQWNALGAGIGRDDAVSEAKAEEAGTRAKLALITKDMPGFAAELNRAEQAAETLFAERLAFYQNGTASLSDLTQTMLLRSRIQQLASSVEGVDMKPIQARWDRDLRELVTIAGAVEDRRGRNEADVLFVNVMNQLDRADQQARAEREAQSPAPSP